MNKRVFLMLFIVLFLFGMSSMFAEGAQEGTGEQPKWLQIEWNQPKPWAERLTGIELADSIPAEYIEQEAWLKDSPNKTLAVGGYIWPEGWEEAVEGVESLTFFNFGGLPHDPAIGIANAVFELETGITMNAQAMEELGLWLKTVAAMTSKRKVPQLLHHSPILSLHHIAAAGWAENMNFFWPQEVQDLYGDGAIGMSKVGDDFWASGFVSIKPAVLFYRPSILEEATGSPEPPNTYQELMEIGKMVAQNTDKYGLAVPGKDYREIWYQMSGAMYSMGGQFIVDGRYDVTTPEYREVFTYMVNLFREGVIPEEAFGWSWTDSPEIFARGRAAFLITGAVNATMWNDNPPPEIEGDWAFRPPLAWGSGTVGKGSIGNLASWAVNVNATEAQKAAAFLYLDLYRSYQTQWNEIGYEGNGCAVPAIYGMDSISSAVFRADIRREAIKYTEGEPLPVNGDQMIQYQLEWLTKAATGEVSIEEALENLENDLETVAP